MAIRSYQGKTPQLGERVFVDPSAVLIGGVPRADALRRLIASGAIDGLSIGFRTVRATRDPRSRHRRLWQIDLWEISIVTFPMLAGARISAGGRLAPAPDGRLLRSLDAAISALKTS